MQYFFGILLCIFASTNILKANVTDTITDEDPYFILMGEADQAINEENWPEAAARLCDAMAVKPNHPSNTLLLNNLASVYINMGQDSLALATYDKALEIAPSMVTILIGKGKLLLQQGRDYEAFDTFEQAIEVDSISSTARYYHGMMALYGGNSSIAERDFEVLQSTTPKSIDTAIALSTLYSLTGRDRQAIPYYELLIEHDPSPEYFAALAGCYLNISNLSKASETLHEAIRRYPSDPELYYYRAWLNRDRYLLDEAHSDAQRAIELGANPARVKMLFAK